MNLREQDLRQLYRERNKYMTIYNNKRRHDILMVIIFNVIICYYIILYVIILYLRYYYNYILYNIIYIHRKLGKFHVENFSCIFSRGEIFVMHCIDEIFTLLKNKEIRNFYLHVPDCERVE